MYDHSAMAAEVESRFGAFLRDRINPTTEQRDQDYATFTPEMLREMAELGLTGFTVSPAIGGAGRSWTDWGHALEEIGYLCDDAGLPMLLSYRESAINLVHRSGLAGRPHLIERYAEPAVRGEEYIGWLLTEDSDLLSFATTVRPAPGGGYRLSGIKKASTGGTSCTCWMVYAATEDGNDVKVLMVERDDPGVTIEPIRSLGLRSLGLCSVSFDDVVLGEDRVVAAADGFSHSQLFVNERRVTGSAWLLGRMRSLIERVVDDALPKVRFHRQVSDFDTFHAGIGQMMVALEAARAVLHIALERTDQAPPEESFLHDPAVAVSKYVAVQSATLVAEIAQKLTGHHGYFEHYGFERDLRDFYGVLPILGGQYAIETQLGERLVTERRLRALRAGR